MEKVKFKQVIVMRNDLNLRKGKMIAQGSHASSLFILDKIKNNIPFSEEEKEWMFGLHYSGPEWKFGGMAKICVRVDSEEELLKINGLAISKNIKSYIVIDSGRTELHGIPTKTCLALGPDKSEKIDLITGHLKLL